MEEKKPLDSLLTHTSKEPEAQLWAQIGTSSYSATATKSPKEEPPAKKTPSKENGKPTETSKAKDEDAGNEYFIDAGNESAKSDEPDQKESKEVPKSKSSTVGDGFSESGAKATKKSASKERSRSRSRERKRSSSSKLMPDYTTNSNNPNDVKSRVFVGHLNTDKCTKEEVAELFEPHGKVIGVNLRDGYGFVQFKDEEAVKIAIKHVHATVFHDMKLVVDRPVAMRKLEASKRAEQRDSRDLMDELAYLRRREQERRYSHYDDIYRMARQPPLYDYMDREDRYGRYGDGPRHDDHYDRGYRVDRYGHYRDDPYDYSYSQRGSSYGDPYGKPTSRRM